MARPARGDAPRPRPVDVPPHEPPQGGGGPSAWQLLKLGTPMALGSFNGLLCQFVLLMLLGHLGGDALYVRSVYGPIALLFAALSVGVGIPMQVLAARSADRAALTRALGSLTRLGLAVFTAVSLVLVLAYDPLADLLRVDVDSRAELRWFVAAMSAVTLLGVPAETAAAALRGAGRTARGTLVSAVGLVGTVVAFVAVDALTDWGLFALPAAVAVAVVPQSVLAGVYLSAAEVPWLGSLRRRAAGAMRTVAVIGLPVAASYAVLFLLNSAYLRIIAPFGPAAVSGFTIAYIAQTMAVVPGIGFGSAVAIAMNQAMAAGRREWIRGILLRGTAMVALVYLAVTVAATLTVEPLTALAVTDEPAREHARTAMYVLAPTFGLMGATLSLIAVLEEVGYGAAMLAGNVVWAVAVVGIGGHLVSRAADATPLYQVMAWANGIGFAMTLLAAFVLVGRGSAKLPSVGGQSDRQLQRR